MCVSPCAGTNAHIAAMHTTKTTTISSAKGQSISSGYLEFVILAYSNCKGLLANHSCIVSMS